MRAISRLMWLLGSCFLAVDGAYLFRSLRANNFEVVGLLTIGLSAVLCLLMAFFFGRTVISAGANVWAEDREDADSNDGDPEVGFSVLGAGGRCCSQPPLLSHFSASQSGPGSQLSPCPF
jgi:hypothetical protein